MSAEDTINLIERVGVPLFILGVVGWFFIKNVWPAVIQNMEAAQKERATERLEFIKVLDRRAEETHADIADQRAGFVLELATQRTAFIKELADKRSEFLHEIDTQGRINERLAASIDELTMAVHELRGVVIASSAATQAIITTGVTNGTSSKPFEPTKKGPVPT